MKSLESLFGSIKKLTMTLINLELPTDLRTVTQQGCAHRAGIRILFFFFFWYSNLGAIWGP